MLTTGSPCCSNQLQHDELITDKFLKVLDVFGGRRSVNRPAVGYVCFAIGVPTGGVGTLICGVAVVGVASFASGAIGGVIGEETGDVIYEIVK